METPTDLKAEQLTQGKNNAEKNVEVIAKPRRRRFTADFKRRVLAELDGCERGKIGMLLRQHGLYASHIDTWRRQLGEGLAPKKRGRKPEASRALQAECERMKRENTRLKLELHNARTVIDIQKKISQLLGLPASEDLS